MKRLESYLQRNHEKWMRLLQDLIQLPSVFEQEHCIVDFVARQIESLGVELHRVEHSAARLRQLPGAQPPFSVVSGRHSLVARVPGHGRGRSLIFNSHLDVVPAGNVAGWTHPPYAGFYDEAKRAIFGRGAMDDKAGVAIALAAMETMLRLPLRLAGDLVFQFVLEDETTGNGSLLCLDAGHIADAAIIIDGTRADRAIHQHAGQMQFDIRVTGTPAPVCVSHLGINAAEILAQLLLFLREKIFGLNERRAAEWRCFPSPYQLVTQSFVADGDQLTVPATATARCYVTFPPPYNLALLRAVLTEWTAEFRRNLPTETGVHLDWRGFATEPVESEHSEFHRCLHSTAAATGIGPIQIGPSTGTSDLRHFVAAKIPCLLYGPGAGFHPHRPDEHYCVDSLEAMVGFFVRLAANWCGGRQFE